MIYENSPQLTSWLKADPHPAIQALAALPAFDIKDEDWKRFRKEMDHQGIPHSERNDQAAFICLTYMESELATTSADTELLKNELTVIQASLLHMRHLINRGLYFLLAVLILMLLLSVRGHAQGFQIIRVSSCGTVPANFPSTVGGPAPLTIDANGNVCTPTGSGGTSSNFGNAFPSAGTAAGARDSNGNMQSLTLDAAGTGANLKVNCSNCSNAATTAAVLQAGAPWSVNVSNTPTVNQGGAWTVKPDNTAWGLTGTAANVFIANSPTIANTGFNVNNSPTVNQGSPPWTVKPDGTGWGLTGTAANVAITNTPTVTANAGSGTFNIQSNATVSIAQIVGSTVTTASVGVMLVGMANGAGNGLTTNSTTYSGKFALDGNLLGTLGTAFTTAGLVDVKAADGNVATVGSRADAKSTATDNTSVSVMQVLKEISALEQVPASRAVTNAGVFQVQAMLQTSTAGIVGEVVPVATPTTTDTLLTNYLTTSATTNATSVKGSAGNVYHYSLSNTTTTIYYLRMYEATGAPTCSSATGFKETIPIPPAVAAGGAGGRERPMTAGQAFTSGIGYCVTGGSSSTDNSNAATGVMITILYK